MFSKEESSVDHDIGIILHLGQRVIVIVHVHLHSLAFCLDTHVRGSETIFGVCYLESMVVFISLTWWHSQVILT